MTGLLFLIREYAAAVEADLAFRQIDFRDYWLPGGGSSRLSLRRLLVLIAGLPYESQLQTALRAADAERRARILPARREHYDAKKAEQEAATA